MKIILTGGGTIGTVSPLLAVKEEMELREIEAEFLWVGTKEGIEKDIIIKEGLAYRSISSGKFRRYFNLQNLIDPFRIVAGVFQSISLIKAYQPDIILSAGGFVSVPMIWAALLLGKKSIIHQQDIKVGLANLLMARCASKITVSFEQSLSAFPTKRAVLLGNPVRRDLFFGDKSQVIKKFNLLSDLPTLLIVGGSLGANSLNKLVEDSIQELTKFCQIIHVVGQGNFKSEKINNYIQIEYLSHHDLVNVYAWADLVVSRGGLSTLTELSALGKPTVVIPIPHNQQEENADFFEKNNAIINLSQTNLTSVEFVSLVDGLFANKASLTTLANNIKKIMPEHASKKFVDLIIKLTK